MASKKRGNWSPETRMALDKRKFAPLVSIHFDFGSLAYNAANNVFCLL